MREDIEKTIRRYFTDVYCNPFEAGHAEAIRARREAVYQIIGDLRSRVTRDLAHSSGTDDELSEEIVFFQGRLTLRLSFLGPFAFYEFTARQAGDNVHEARLHEVFEKHELIVLLKDEVEAAVPWIQARLVDTPSGSERCSASIQVRHCLFGD